MQSARETLHYLALINNACAGLDSITQVFSVISSCIVDVSVGRYVLDSFCAELCTLIQCCHGHVET